MQREKGGQAGAESKVVFGIYQHLQILEKTVDVLREAGFRNTDISVLFRDDNMTKDFARKKNTKVADGGAIGGIAGALIGLGISDHEAKHYEDRIKDGGILLAVHADNAELTIRAGELLQVSGAEDIGSELEVKVALG
jgi:hypothetical protein